MTAVRRALPFAAHDRSCVLPCPCRSPCTDGADLFTRPCRPCIVVVHCRRCSCQYLGYSNGGRRPGRHEGLAVVLGKHEGQAAARRGMRARIPPGRAQKPGRRPWRAQGPGYRPRGLRGPGYRLGGHKSLAGALGEHEDPATPLEGYDCPATPLGGATARQRLYRGRLKGA